MSRRQRGVALVTVLLLSMIMLILGLSFLYYLERDYRFAGQADRSQQAYYLARAGLQYQRSRLDLCYPGAPPVERHLPAGNPQAYFVLTLEPSGKIESRGVVKSPLGAIIAERSLVVEPAMPVRQFRDKSR